MTSIAARTAVVTVRLADPGTDPKVAVIMVLPLPRLVANPFVPGELLTVATDGADELQWAEVVTSWTLPSVKVP